MTAKPTLYGAPDSVYVRIVRMALYHKNVDYDLVPVDVFADGGVSADYLQMHPFGRIPAFVHAGFHLYETSAITRYVDEAFDGAALVHGTVQQHARVNQIVSVLDSYCYWTLVWDIYVERVEKQSSDEAKIVAALVKARTCLAALAGLFEGPDWFVGNAPSLADLHAAPMIAYFIKTSEGAAMLDEFPVLARWWTAVSNLECFKRTDI